MFTLPLAALALVPLVAGHGFIKTVTVNGQTTTAQKTNRQQSSFRSVSDNTGWIGSDFFSSDCAICGCSDTPGGRVAAPGGSIFADAGQGAGQTPTVKAGDTITLHVAGNPGEGWPHPNGHLMAYMGECGAGGCTNQDVRQTSFFKVQQLPNGVPPLRAAFDRASDSNPWPITIPSAVKAGKYILRSEIWAYGQSSQAEGGQVQMYPFCMNVEVTGGGTANPATVKFPAAIATDTQIESQGISYLPGPAVNQLFGGSGTGTGSGSSSKAGSPASAPANNSPAPAPVQNSPAPAPVNSPSPPSSGTNTGSGSTGGIVKSTKSGRKCAAPKSGSRKRSRSHRRHHHKAQQRHAS